MTLNWTAIITLAAPLIIAPSITRYLTYLRQRNADFRQEGEGEEESEFFDGKLLYVALTIQE